jgi:MoaA/NifB/PqqE/SkfB family radical SAM enzyme
MMFKPLYVVQELSARCYAGCPGCFRTFVKGPRDGDMTPECFEAGLRGIPAGTMILPQFHGESLLHPEFPKMLTRYRELGLRVSIPVSASAGHRYIPLLVGPDSPVYILIVSIDGFLPETHAVRRGSITLERAEEFARECVRTRERRPSPLIAVRWVDGEQSEIEFERYLKKWLFEEGVDFVLRSRLFNYGSEMNSAPIGRCLALEEGAPVILFNGDVLLCERTADRERCVLGNVFKESWDDLMSHRETIVKRENPCARCSAAYLLTGVRGMIWFRSMDSISEGQTIYIHSDHSQTFYSLKREWKGISWELQKERELVEQVKSLE